MWSSPDDLLIEQAKRELSTLGLAEIRDMEAGYVVRMPKAYPFYDQHYQANVEVLKEWLAANAPNVWPVGRNGMHKYNNQDHSMLTAMLTVENIVHDAGHDIWAVNVDEEYHEEKSDGAKGTGGTGRDAPILPRRAAS
jgi:protoporphyrinogen oxidase